ncbi:MAG: type IV secretory system conjugative DNA transfer family protein, partial [Oscillospiraceae bacterium]|nr:type IV secretory system conjugative DNA transfer family protein [Oscillospiraceae bacterium]
MPNIPYVFIFWFANKIGTAYRLAEGKDVLNKIAGSVKTLGESMSDIAPSFHPFDLFIGVCGAALIFAFVYFRGKNAKKFRKNVEYGSACWGNEKNIRPYVDPKPDNNIILTATESLTMESRPKDPKYARNKNVLVVGGSGSGKTRFFCKPNIMQLHSSYVITDPKAQLLIETGKLLEDNGYKIKVLNTIDFKKSHKYNPFEYIKSEKDILKFVTALISNTKGEGKSSDDFWQKAETLLYQALIGYIWYEGPPRERNMNTLVEMINNMEVREDDETFMNSVDFLFEALAERAPNHFALRQYKKFKLSAGKTAKSILISCGARLS